ncbi:unnamed protein product [Effrenium voratum]|nr:unnamed protein product [Effrenium voratum]
MSDFDRVTGLRTGGSDHDHESDSESSEVVLKHKKDYVAALQGAGVAASMNWKLASLQEAWNQHKRGGGHSEATAVEEPAAEATVEEPAAEAAVEEPAAEATVEEPAAEAAVEEPAAEAAVEEPAAVKEPRPMEAVDAVKVGQSPDPPCRQVPSEELQLAAIAQQLVQLPRSERISRLEVLVSSWKSQDDSFCLPKAVEVNVREEPAKKTKAVAEPAREKPPLKKRRNYYLQAMRSLGVKTTWSTGQGGSGRLGFVLSEPFNREAVEHFGSLRAAAQLGFRRALAALLVRDTEAAGVVKVAYRECHTVADLFDVETLGRAYGGYVAKHYEELAKRLKKIDPVKGQDDVDAISAQMGIYMQLPPEVCRSGMPLVDIDQQCSAGRILLGRHPSAARLGHFVRNRDSYLDMLPVEREDAKEFFTGLLFGGGSGRCREFEDQHGVRLPQCVQDLIAELRALRDIDEKKYENQMRMLATEYPGKTLQAFLHQIEERRISSAFCAAVEAQGLGRPVSWEHDGVVFAPLRDLLPEEVDLWRQRVLCAAQAAVPDSPLGIKAYQSMEELLRHFKTIHPECDWETVDNDWVEQEQVRFQLSAYLSAGVESVDYLAAQLLPGHVLNNGVLVLDTYKCVPTSTRHTETAMFDEGKGRWTLAKSAHAETTLADVVKQVYIDSTPEDWVGLPPKVAFQIASLRKVANTAMEKGLYDPYFFAELDGNKYRDFLLFLRMSRSLGISYPGDLMHKLDVLNVAALLEEVACFEDGLPEKDYTSEDMFPQTLADRLWNLSQHPEFAALRFLFSSHESWPRVLFLLKFAAFQLCSTKSLEDGMLWVGAGKNGKNAWMSMLLKLFGDCGHTPPKEVLTKPPQPPDEAAPVRFGLRGRRLLWFNELEEKHPIQSTIFKDFRDHATTLTARTLYGDNVDFNVTWGMVLATNSRVSWTAEDGGVGRSLTKVRWPLRFVAPGMPLGPNDRVVDLRWKATAVVDSVAPGLLYLLLQVYKVFLPRLTDTQIHPRPHCVVLETGDSSETFYASKAVANFVETTGTLPKSGPDCLGWQAALEAFTASARGINRVGARDIFKAEFEAHKYCGKLLAKHRETKAFLASSKR